MATRRQEQLLQDLVNHDHVIGVFLAQLPSISSLSLSLGSPQSPPHPLSPPGSASRPARQLDKMARSPSLPTTPSAPLALLKGFENVTSEEARAIATAVLLRTLHRDLFSLNNAFYVATSIESRGYYCRSIEGKGGLLLIKSTRSLLAVAFLTADQALPMAEDAIDKMSSMGF